MRLLSRSRELKRLDAIFKHTGQRSVRLLDSMLWLRGGTAEPVVRKVELVPATPVRRSPIDYGLRRRA